MTLDLLPPDRTLTLIGERLAKLSAALKKLKANCNDTTHSHLRISQKGKHCEYYQVTKQTAPLGKYISKKKQLLIRQLAQKDYDTKLISLLESEILATTQYISKISDNSPPSDKAVSQHKSKITQYYEKMSLARKELITPVTLSNEQYIKEWMKETWQPLPFSEDTPFFYTARGERVRSKSEVIIADSLFRHNIPYRYEYPLALRHFSRNNLTKEMNKTVIFHPDFLCLNTYTRQEFIWEHMGLMDSPEYAENTIGKLRIYAENGIFPGHRLIITMETQNQPISTQIIEKIIPEYFADDKPV